MNTQRGLQDVKHLTRGVIHEDLYHEIIRFDWEDNSNALETMRIVVKP